MAVVRCPIHDIPYNDSNPRGCPACASEREGSDPTTDAIRELARASTAIRRPESQPAVEAPAPAPPSPGRPSVTVLPITPPPRAPTAEETRLGRLGRWAREQRIFVGTAVIALATLTYFALTAGPQFAAGSDPPRYTGTVHALPMEPGQPVDVVFTILGPRQPTPHPQHQSLARYAYGSRLLVDALNNAVYEITIGVPNWTWRGLTVGLSQRQTEGTLALLGSATTVEEPEFTEPQRLRRWAVYSSLEGRPRRVLRVEVRPPNGCMDVFAELRPRAIGILQTRERPYAVVGEAGTSPEWVSTEIRVVNRAVLGPAGPAACPAPFPAFSLNP